MSVSRLIGLSLNDEAVAVLNFSQRLMELPIGVFAVAVSTVVFPLISRHAAAGDAANLASAYRKGMRLILVINVPAAAGLAVLALPIIRVIFQHGAFDPDATRTMTPVLIANALGLPFFSFVNLALRAFYAEKDTKTPVKAAVLSFVVNVVLSLALMGPLSTLGLAIASTIAIAVQAAYLQWHLARRQDGLAFHHLAADLAKVIVASVAMAAIVAAGWWAWTRVAPVSKFADGAGIMTLVAAGVAIYGGLVWMLKIEGRAEVTGLWAKMRRKTA
jgi:putative peptidoglycan lipid II flippase